VELLETVVLGVKEAVPVPEGVGLPVEVGLGVGEGVPLLDSDVLPLLEAEAPAVREAVGEADTVELLETVVLGVKEAVPVPEGVGLPVEVGLGVGGGVPLLDSDVLPLLEAEAPAVREAVGDADTVELLETVVLGVKEASHCALLNSSHGSLLPGTTPKARTSTAAAPPPVAGGSSASAPLGRGAAPDGAAMAHRSTPPRTPQKAAARGFKPLALVASSAAARASAAPGPLLETTSEASALPAAAPLPCAHAAMTLPSADSERRVPAVTLASSRSGGAGAPSASSSSCVSVASSRCVLFERAAVPRLRTNSVARRAVAKPAGAATRNLRRKRESAGGLPASACFNEAV
jgi:hypothetical protein